MARVAFLELVEKYPGFVVEDEVLPLVAHLAVNTAGGRLVYGLSLTIEEHPTIEGAIAYKEDEFGPMAE